VPHGTEETPGGSRGRRERGLRRMIAPDRVGGPNQGRTLVGSQKPGRGSRRDPALPAIASRLEKFQPRRNITAF
jgi:hypothetical protein